MAEELSAFQWLNKINEIHRSVQTNQEYVGSIVSFIPTRSRDDLSKTHIDVIADLDDQSDRRALGSILDNIAAQYRTPEMQVTFSQYTPEWYLDTHPDAEGLDPKYILEAESEN